MDRQHHHAPGRRQRDARSTTSHRATAGRRASPPPSRGLPPLPARVPAPGRAGSPRAHRPQRIDEYRSGYRDTARRERATPARSAKRWPWAGRAQRPRTAEDPRKAAAAAALAERRAKARRARSRSTTLHLDLHASGLPGRPHVNPIGLSITLILAVCTWVILLAQPFGGAMLGPTMPSSAFIIIVGLGLYVMWQLDNKYD
ncbi:hypothetical protein HT102_09810 [Hoyosella sp. G463]|uniref:Uncharacterized protein n=1 Tax=Lolliginicoccus lacisalsi TaxID=2742202 RepID=A0A927PMM8_9ACTN|nr:hypothetical protein [Lolliginicoccus lacisalsi]MBD8506782.1 hypothetical protein [Lolliginicoccus lacisalsi]